MIHAVASWNRPEFERVDTLEAANVVPVFQWIRATPVVSVHATSRTEEVFGRTSVELIHAKSLLTSNNGDTSEGYRGNDGTTSSAQRTVAPAWIHDTLGQIQFQHYRPTVARGAMFGHDWGRADSLDHGFILGCSVNRITSFRIN
jgi:hypothetical protein